MGAAKDLSIKVKKTLITGGGGFVGRAVAACCLDAGIETVIVGRNFYPDLVKRGARCIAGNICDRSIMEKATRGVDCVFHIAALAGIWGTWPDYYTTNVSGTENVIRSCTKNEVKVLVYTSTPSVVFDRKNICAGTEALPYADNPLCNYARSKILAEKLVLSANTAHLRTCALRPHLIWGPGDPHLIPRLIKRGRLRQLKQVGRGDNLVDISYIDNVAHAHILAAANLCNSGTAAGRAYFISQGEPVNLWDWINNLFNAADVPPVQSKVSFKTAFALGYLLEIIYALLHSKNEPRMTRFLAEQLAKSHYFSIDKARSELGYYPLVSTEKGLEKTIEWLRNVT